MGYTRSVRNKPIMERSYPSILWLLLRQLVKLMKTLNSFRLNLTCLIYKKKKNGVIGCLHRSHKIAALHTIKIEFINVLQNCLPYKRLMLSNWLHLSYFAWEALSRWPCQEIPHALWGLEDHIMSSRVCSCAVFWARLIQPTPSHATSFWLLF
jgi:hypothetical protein